MALRAVVPQKRRFPWFLQNKLNFLGNNGDPYDSLPIRENLLRRMEEADISLSVVQPVVSRPETQTDVNRFAREIVRTNLISFGGLHPDCPHVLEEIEKLKDLHMAGVKFHPPFQKVHLEDGKRIY